MRTNYLAKSRIMVLGSEGQMGSKMLAPLVSMSKLGGGLDIKSIPDTNEITKEVIEFNPEVTIMAITADKQANEGVKMMRDFLVFSPKGLKIIVQINSVQHTVHRAYEAMIPEVAKLQKGIILVSLHPLHNPAGFDSLDAKKWILTDINCYGKTPASAEIIEKMKEVVAVFPTHCQTQKGQIDFVDLSAGFGDFTGSQAHDWIMSYYQSVFHMVKLLPGVNNEDWYQKEFSHVTAKKDLSLAIINDNPYSKKLHLAFLEMIGEDYDRKNIIRVVKEMLSSAENVIPQKFKKLKTKNIEILETL